MARRSDRRGLRGAASRCDRRDSRAPTALGWCGKTELNCSFCSPLAFTNDARYRHICAPFADRHPQSPSIALLYAVVVIGLNGVVITLWTLIALMNNSAVLWAAWAVLATLFGVLVLLQVHRYRYQAHRSVPSDPVGERV
jgi:hypothetical protein